MGASFTPNPDGLRKLEEQMKRKLEPMNAEINELIGARGDKSMDQLATDVAAVMRRYDVAPNPQKIRELLTDAVDK